MTCFRVISIMGGSCRVLCVTQHMLDDVAMVIIDTGVCVITVSDDRQ